MSADTAPAPAAVDHLDTDWRGSIDHVLAAAAHPQRSRDQVHDLVTGRRRTSLLGRTHECGVIDRLVQDAGSGQSAALVLRGEPGVGKTALADYAVDSAHGFALVRTVGVESEMELPFAALHQFCASFAGPARAAPRTPALTRWKSCSGCALGRRPTGSSSAWQPSPCCQRRPRRARSCASSTMRSGWIKPRRKRSCSWRAGFSPSPWRCSS